MLLPWLSRRGEKVASTSPDYCSYRPDADNSSITPERLVEAALRVLAGASGDKAIDLAAAIRRELREPVS